MRRPNTAAETTDLVRLPLLPSKTFRPRQTWCLSWLTHFARLGINFYSSAHPTLSSPTPARVAAAHASLFFSNLGGHRRGCRERPAMRGVVPISAWLAHVSSSQPIRFSPDQHRVGPSRECYPHLLFKIFPVLVLTEQGLYDSVIRTSSSRSF